MGLVMEYVKTVIYVDDVEETLDFYYQAFAISTLHIDENSQYGELDIGGCIIGFAAHPLAQSHFKQGYIRTQPKQPALGFELMLRCKDIEQVYQKAVSAGAEPLTKPFETESGKQLAYVRSIEGTLISLTQ